ncbi:MAG: c-type cytochrome, partial [Planctomycetaceae bacterium]|nr:c-type cytochrome [Planctomycetaceae bacterium]
KGWTESYKNLLQFQDESVQKDALRLALVFDDPIAFQRLRSIAIDQNQLKENRQEAIQSLIKKRPKDLPTLLLQLIRDPSVQHVALLGLAEYSDPKIGEQVLELFQTLSTTGRQDALQTLSSRKVWAMSLLDAVEAKKIPSGEFTAYTARQLENLDDKDVSSRLKSLWGTVRQTPADKAKQMVKYKKQMTQEALSSANRTTGRALFKKNCANCHKLFGEGGVIGPDLTGAQRTNLDYLLENLIDPSAAVAKDYQMEKLVTTEGRIITGLPIEETETALTIQTVNEKVVVPIKEIDVRAKSDLSMMPDGLLEKLTSEEIRDLIAYLSGIEQAPEK